VVRVGFGADGTFAGALATRWIVLKSVCNALDSVEKRRVDFTGHADTEQSVPDLSGQSESSGRSVPKYPETV